MNKTLTVNDNDWSVFQINIGIYKKIIYIFCLIHTFYFSFAHWRPNVKLILHDIEPATYIFIMNILAFLGMLRNKYIF